MLEVRRELQPAEERRSANDFSAHPAYSCSAKVYFNKAYLEAKPPSIRARGSEYAIRPRRGRCVVEERAGSDDGMEGTERDGGVVVVGIRIHEWEDISNAWLPYTALHGSMGFTSPYDKIA